MIEQGTGKILRRASDERSPERRARSLAALFLLAGQLAILRDVAARDFPPLVPPPRPFVLPEPIVRVLSNGLKLVVIERHSLPLVTLRLVVKAGAEADPAGLAGMAQLVAAVLTEGTATRNANEIAKAIDDVGGRMETGADWDASYATVSVLTDHGDLAFDLLADIASRPAFTPAEVERKRKQTLSALEIVREDPGYIADAVFNRLIFSGTPYSHPEDGTVESVRRMTVEDLKSFHSRFYRPANSILAVVGDISPEEAVNRAGKHFGAWQNGPAVSQAEGVVAWKSGRRVVIIDKPDAVQTEIRVGNLAVRRDSPDFYALSVANQILGGPATNRLFKALRSQQGLTYGASSDLVCHQPLGNWVAKTFTRTAETGKSLQLVLEQLNRLRDIPISEQELDAAQGYLVGHLALDFESAEGVAGQILELLVHNLPLDYWNRFPEKIRALTAQDVWMATRRYLDSERNVIVLVGNAAAFKKDLKKVGAVRVIAVQALDLASPDLEQGRGASAGP